MIKINLIHLIHPKKKHLVFFLPILEINPMEVFQLDPFHISICYLNRPIENIWNGSALSFFFSLKSQVQPFHKNPMLPFSVWADTWQSSASSGWSEWATVWSQRLLPLSLFPSAVSQGQQTLWDWSLARCTNSLGTFGSELSLNFEHHTLKY